MKFKESICEKFGHNWNYFKVDSIDVRCCKRCGKHQHRMVMGTHKFWTFSVQYTEQGAKEFVEGYGEI